MAEFNAVMCRLAYAGLVLTFLLSLLAMTDVSEHSSASALRANTAPAPDQPEGFDLQGHRGARGLAPENTWPAFERALELGVTTLEMDVVISKDGEVVVSHEPWMSSTICSLPSGEPIPSGQGRNHRIFEMTYEEVQQYDCGQRRHPDFPEQQTQPAHKPLLRDVIQQAETYMAQHRTKPVFYNIETKSQPGFDGRFHPEPKRFAQLVYDVVAEMNVAARTTLQSFDVRTLQVAEENGWPVRLALLIGRGDDEGLNQNIERLGFRPDVYSPEYRLVDEELLIKAHGWGMDVIPWTVNDTTDMRRLQEMGADGLITDYPNRAQFLLDDDAGASDS